MQKKENNQLGIKYNLNKAKQELEGDRITIGLATCGISAGADLIYDIFKNSNLDVPIEKVGCMGMCYNEPIVTVTLKGKTSIFKKVNENSAKEIIHAIKYEDKCGENVGESFLTNNVEKLDFYKKQKRIVMENCGLINPFKIEHYFYQGGYLGLKKAISLKNKDIIEEITQSGLRGRGGAGFPTGKKWSFISEKKGKKYLICNGDEGDPGAFMNRTLMESDPFRIIEGMTIGAYATGASEGIIYTRAEYPLAIEILQKAIDSAYKFKLLGENILGKKDFNFDLRIQKGAGAFVCGEETALINSLEGKRGQPKPRPPFPAEKGLYGKPTIVNNVGTWGHVTTILKIGSKKYSSIGTEKTKGTKIICLTGKVKRTGVVEVPFGITLRELVYDIGGGTTEGTEFKGLLSGGPAGGIVPKKYLNTPLDYEEMSNLGTIIGSGGFIITNNKSCVVNIAKYFMNFSQEESCGKCTPCREGTKRILEILIKITKGIATKQNLKDLKELAEFVRDNSLCGLGQNAPNPVLSTLKHFNKEYLEHIEDKKCSAHACENLLTYFITDKCVGCGACKRNCPVQCISGNPKERHIIDQSKCIKCGRCYEVCRFNSITR